jgi:prolyl oligopeptidase
MENGGVYAVPNLRGGGEYGKNGTMPEPNAKQNVFDDCSSRIPDCSEIHLFTIPSHSWWVKRRIVVGATMTQRPELMKVALPAVGVMDMLPHLYRRSRLGV